MKRLIFIFIATVSLCVFQTSCRDDEPTRDDIENRDDNGGKKDDGGDQNGNDNKNDDDNENNGGGNTSQYTDVFQAFSAKDSQFWYRWVSKSSRVSYGKGRVENSSWEVRTWNVNSVSGNMASLDEYVNMNFRKASGSVSFSRNKEGALLCNGKQVTMTNTPDFYAMYLNFKSSDVRKETYDAANGMFMNTYHTTSNGYTTSVWRSMTEYWGPFGLYESSYEDSDPDPEIGSYNKKMILVSAFTANGTYHCNSNVGKAPTPVFTNISGNYENDGSASITLYFNHEAKTENTWAYEVAYYSLDEKWYRMGQFTDIDTYFSGYRVKDGSAASSTTHNLTFKVTPTGVAMGKANGALYFSVIALGYGYMSDPAEPIGIGFGDSSSQSPMRRVPGKLHPNNNVVQLTAEPDLLFQH